MNASEVARFFPIENGIGYGSARVSVLFRPVQVKFPPSLLGFDVGTLMIRKLSAMPVAGESGKHLLPMLQSCEVKLKASAASDKVPKRSAEQKEGGSVVWDEERPSELPVQQRYSSALRLKFKESGALKSSQLGMAALWLRDIVDNEDMTIDVALFKSQNYNRLKQNYAPPDGNLDYWSRRDDSYRDGTARLDVQARHECGAQEEYGYK